MICDKLKFIVIIFTFIQHISGEEYEYYDDEQYYEDVELVEFCRGIEFGAFIPSPRGKKYYIFCGETRNKSYEAKCPNDMPIFKDGICDAPITTTTPKDVITTKNLITTTAPISSKTTKRPTTSSSETTTTTKTTRTTKTTPRPTTKPTTTTKKSTIIYTTPKISTKITTIKTTNKIVPTTIQPDFCPTNDNSNYVIFLPSKKNCYEYFICYHGNPLPMYCANKLHFNPVTYKCDFPEKVQCKINESVKPFPKCKTVTEIEFYEHPNNCNYFLCCIFGNMSVQQCPYLHNWDIMSESCIPKHMSTCENKRKLY